MSADIFKNAANILGDTFAAEDSGKLGTVVIGTVKEDIHDIGKDIVVTILKCNGLNVIDLEPVRLFARKNHYETN